MEIVAGITELTNGVVHDACQKGGALRPVGSRRPYVIWDVEGDHNAYDDIFLGLEADDFSVASADASDTDSDDSEACFEFPPPLNTASIFSDGGSVMGTALDKCSCGCGGCFAPSDGSIPNQAELARLHSEGQSLFPNEMRPDAVLPATYLKTMAMMAKGNMEELQTYYLKNSGLSGNNGEGAGAAADTNDADADAGEGEGAGAAADTNDADADAGEGEGEGAQSAIKAAVATPEFEEAMEQMRKAFSGVGLQAGATAASERNRRADGETVPEATMMELFGTFAAAVMNGDLDQVARASDELKMVTIPSNVPMLVLMRTPWFHRLVLWFMKHSSGSSSTYDDIVSDYATVLQAVCICFAPPHLHILSPPFCSPL